MSALLLASNAAGISFIVLLSVLTIVVFALAVWVICLGLKGEAKFKIKPIYIFVILLVVGAAVRMAIGFSMRGLVGSLSAFSPERAGYSGLVGMVQSLLSNGFSEFEYMYEGVYQYPLTMFVLAFFGSICSLFSQISISSIATLIFIKLPFVISDMLLAFLVYKIAEKYAGDVVALGVGGLVAVCPVFMLGTIWPSAYTFLALALVATLYFMLERKYILLVVTYTIALLTAFEAVYLVPVIAVFLIYAYIKKIKAYRQSDKQEGLWSSEYGLIVKLPVTIVVCMIASYLVILPFALSSIGANPFVILYHYYLRPFNEFGYFTYNGLSLYSVFNKNGASLSLTFPKYVFSILFAAAIIAVTLIIYLTKKNRANLLMYASYMLLTINVYFVNSSELTLLPCLALLLIAFAVVKDKRLLKIFGILAFVVFLNASLVLLKSGYYETEANFVSEALNGNWLAASIVTSVIAVLVHLYYTMVILDIVMNGKIKKLDSDGSFGSSIKTLIKVKD